MEIPNNAKTEEIMDFKKFAQSVNLMYSEEKVFIKGTFKEIGNGRIVEGDNFWANKVNKSGEKINAELIYKTYLNWFNYTLRNSEKPREFVHAEFEESKEFKE